MKTYLLPLTILSLLLGCSRQAEVPKAPPKPVEYKKRVELPNDVDQWKTSAMGMPSKMTFSNAKEENGETYMALVNDAKAGDNIYMSIGKLVSGLKPNSNHRIYAWIKNHGSPYLLFITTDPIWDKRIMCEAKTGKWVLFSDWFKSDENGELVVRMVCERKGMVYVKNVAVELPPE